MGRLNINGQLAYLYFHECNKHPIWIEQHLKMRRDSVLNAIYKWRKRYPDFPIFKEERFLSYPHPPFADLRNVLELEKTRIV